MPRLNPEIIRAVTVTAELTGANLSEVAVEAMVEHLSGYPVEVVLSALRRCQVELRGPMTLGAVMDRLDDGHLGPEAAWALVAHLTESSSVVWTDEIAQSFGGVRLMLDDRVAARMAFLEDYRRRLSEARAERRRPTWWASFGHDQAGRVAALEEAVALKRLSAPRARGCLPPHEWPRGWVDQPALPAAAIPVEVGALIAEITKKSNPKPRGASTHETGIPEQSLHRRAE